MHGTEFRGYYPPKGRFQPSGRFGRMFRHLRSLKTFSPGPEALGKVGGPMDGGSDGADATQDNPRIPAGFTFLGQFLDHDITFDPTSSLEQQNDPGAIQNFRTPAFELDSVYGGGPSVQPFMYDAKKFILSEDGIDMPRTRRRSNTTQLGIIGDPRNDENLLISQLHVAMMKFHNAVLERHAGGDFETAQRLVRWHYQWIVLNEFLRLSCGDAVVDDILTNGRKFFTFDDEAFMPVEFSVAAYRFGHSQVRPGYRVNGNFAAGLFPDDPTSPLPGRDLRGSQPVGEDRRVDWKQFFGDTAQRGRLIDTRLNSRLLNLPDTVVDAGSSPSRRSLAVRNLERSMVFALPSGQSVSCFMGIAPLTEAEVWKDVAGGRGDAPLWFYILREAEIHGKGEQLAGVGARIVAEVFIGLLEGDKASFRSQNPLWKPTLPAKKPGTFLMTDLFAIAGV